MNRFNQSFQVQSTPNQYESASLSFLRTTSRKVNYPQMDTEKPAAALRCGYVAFDLNGLFDFRFFK